MQVLTRVGGGCVVHRCQNKNQIERLTSGCECCHAPEARAGGILGILKKSEGSWVLPREKTVGFHLLAVPHVLGGGGRWKSQNRKNVYLSPYVEEPFNSKVLKSFVPELRSRYVFFEFRDLYVLCSMFIYMNIICPFRISISGYGTVFHCSLSVSKCLQVSPGFFTVFCLIWWFRLVLQFQTLPNPLSKPLRTVPNAPIAIGIIVFFMFHCFSVL